MDDLTLNFVEATLPRSFKRATNRSGVEFLSASFDDTQVPLTVWLHTAGPRLVLRALVHLLLPGERGDILDALADVSELMCAPQSRTRRAPDADGWLLVYDQASTLVDPTGTQVRMTVDEFVRQVITHAVHTSTLVHAGNITDDELAAFVANASDT